MPEPPILILLAPPIASPEAANIARGPEGDPVILGLSLIQRTVLAARRADYGQVFLLGGNVRGTPGAAIAVSNKRIRINSPFGVLKKFLVLVLRRMAQASRFVALQFRCHNQPIHVQTL